MSSNPPKLTEDQVKEYCGDLHKTSDKLIAYAHTAIVGSQKFVLDVSCQGSSNVCLKPDWKESPTSFITLRYVATEDKNKTFRVKYIPLGDGNVDISITPLSPTQGRTSTITISPTMSLHEVANRMITSALFTPTSPSTSTNTSASTTSTSAEQTSSYTVKSSVHGKTINAPTTTTTTPSTSTTSTSSSTSTTTTNTHKTPSNSTYPHVYNTDVRGSSKKNVFPRAVQSYSDINTPDYNIFTNHPAPAPSHLLTGHGGGNDLYGPNEFKKRHNTNPGAASNDMDWFSNSQQGPSHPGGLGSNGPRGGPGGSSSPFSPNFGSGPSSGGYNPNAPGLPGFPQYNEPGYGGKPGVGPKNSLNRPKPRFDPYGPLNNMGDPDNDLEPIRRFGNNNNNNNNNNPPFL